DHQRLHHRLAALVERRPLEDVQHADHAALFRDDDPMPGGRPHAVEAAAELGLVGRIAELVEQAADGREVGLRGVTQDHVYLRISSITMPSLGRLPTEANSTLPPTLQTVRIVPSSAVERSGEGCAASTLSVMTSAWLTQSITRRRRPRPGCFFDISARSEEHTSEL